MDARQTSATGRSYSRISGQPTASTPDSYQHRHRHLRSAMLASNASTPDLLVPQRNYHREDAYIASRSTTGSGDQSAQSWSPRSSRYHSSYSSSSLLHPESTRTPRPSFQDEEPSVRVVDAAISEMTDSDVNLVKKARSSRQYLRHLARQKAFVGKWKRRRSGIVGPTCQLFDCITQGDTGQEYRVVARANLQCSLREVMNVLSTDNVSKFHRSMIALFGDHYAYGVNQRLIDCSSIASEDEKESSARLAVNSVLLLLRPLLMWRQHTLSFLDYLEEDVKAKCVTRVVQSVPSDETSEYTWASSASASSSAAELGGFFSGYVLQEDQQGQFTRLFFYGTQASGSNGRKVDKAAMHLLRDMAALACNLEAIVFRRRLGLSPSYKGLGEVEVWDPNGEEGKDRRSPSTVVGSECVLCGGGFGILKKAYVCYLCHCDVCGKCSKKVEVEQRVGSVDKRRVCKECVKRVRGVPLEMKTEESQEEAEATEVPILHDNEEKSTQRDSICLLDSEADGEYADWDAVDTRDQKHTKAA